MAWIKDAAGDRRSVEMPGPRDPDTWEECFRVFATAAVMLGLCRPTVLDKYCRALRRRALEYPDQWHLVYKAEVKCRQEFWVEERRRQALWDLEHPGFSAVDKAMPYETVFRESLENKDYLGLELACRRHLREAARKSQCSQMQ